MRGEKKRTLSCALRKRACLWQINDDSDSFYGLFILAAGGENNGANGRIYPSSGITGRPGTQKHSSGGAALRVFT